MFKCKKCGKIVIKYPSVIKKWSHYYCSQKCQRSDRWKRIKFICQYCEKIFETVPSRRVNKRIFCSKKCWYKFYKEKHPKFKKRIIKRRKKKVKSLSRSIKWSKAGRDWRKAVFERDNYTCQFPGCGVKSGIGRVIYLEPHHIVTVRDIIEKYKLKTMDDAVHCKELWNVDNGITLCKPCHKLTFKKEQRFEKLFKSILESKKK